MDHEENGVSPLSNDNLFFLYYIFRICGLLISKYDPWWWKFYNILILFYLFSILIGLIISNLFNQINDEPFHIVTIILLCANGCISYLTMTSITLYYGYNLIHIIKSMSTNDMNIYERIHNLRNESSLNNLLLRAFCLKWLAIAFFIGVVSVIFFFVVYGAHADTHFLDLNNNIGWRIVTNIAYIYVNIGWLLPMVLVRVGSHFLERRILRLIAYLELPNDENRKQSDSDTTISEIIVSVAHSFQTSPSPVENNLPSDLTEHNISITQVMSWYDDIYTLNQILSDAFSPIIFQAILLLFPIIIFILEGFLTNSITPAKLAGRIYWLATNCFILFILTGSAARLDALNIRIETAFASMPSSIMFATPASVCQYRLALSKIQAMPLGINFFGLRKRITYQSMWTISSVVISIFLFMLGYSA